MKVKNIIPITRDILTKNNYSRSKTLKALIIVFKVDPIEAEMIIDHCLEN